jgi:hypothetical protein
VTALRTAEATGRRSAEIEAAVAARRAAEIAPSLATADRATAE